MAELNLNFDPEWLRSGQSESKPMSLSEAFQSRQHQQQIDAQKALLPLRQQEMKANIANAALDQQIKQEQMEVALKMKANDAEGWKRASQVDSWLDPSQVNPIYEAGPFSPELTRFLQGRQQSAEIYSARVEEAKARQRTESRPTAVVQTVLEADLMEQQALTAEAADDPIAARRLRKNAELLLGSVRGPQVPTTTAAYKNAEALVVADESMLASRGAPPMTTAERADKFRLYLAEQTARPGEETVMESTPGGGVTVTTRRGVKSGPTVGTETKIQSELAQLQASTQQLRTTISTIRPQDVGVAGKIGDIKNRIIKQFVRGVGDPSVSANRAQAERSLGDYLATQVQRGRITVQERNRMRGALFDPQSMAQSHEQVIEVADTMARLQQMDAVAISKSAKQPLNDWMFIGLTKKDYDNLRQSGALTNDEAWEWFQKVNSAQ